MNYQCVYTISQIQRYLADAKIVAFDFETSPLDAYRDEDRAALDAHKADIVGVSFSVAEGSAIYVPLKHRIGRNADDAEHILTALTYMLWANPKVIKVAHNLAFEAMFLYAKGIVMQAPVYDTIAAAQLTLKNGTEFRKLSDSGLKKLAPTLCGAELPDFETVTGGRHFDELDPQDAETIRYACADSDYALQLYHIFNQWFDLYLPKHRRIVEEIESPTAVYCGLMKYNGIPMDKATMLQKQQEAELAIADLRAKIAFIIGDVDIGANASTAAFKRYLFTELGLPVLKTTAKFQEAADDETMILLAEWCRDNRPELEVLFRLVQEYRRWGKLKSTYIDGYLQQINTVTGCIHPNLMPLGTDTGRFASRNPNMQNCFDDQTEVLTRRGFVLFSALQKEDCVAQWDNGDIYFVKPTEYIARQHTGEMIRLKNVHTNLLLTPDHRCLLQNRKNKQFFVVPAEDYCSDAKQLHAGQFMFGSKQMSPAAITLLAATQADGHYHDGGIDFSFIKARKYRRLVNALKELDAPYSDYVKADGHVNVRLRKGELAKQIMSLLGNDKAWGDWLLDYDRQTVKAVLAELPEWDGCFTRGSAYSSSIKKNTDWMQIVYALTGIRAHLREYRNGNPNSVTNYQLDISDRDYSLTTGIEKTREPYNGMVYCVSVPSGFIVVRRGGDVCITGNCPRKDNDPVGVRSFIVAPAGKCILSLDFSQIELRVGAFYCQDEKMLETYRSGGDIHAQTTAVIYHIPFAQAADKNAQHYKERRTIAKNCNFGVFFGLFARGLQRTLKFKAGLDTPLYECESIIENLKAGYPQLSTWQEEVTHCAAVRKYTETWFGRRRYLPGIASSDWGKRSFAERCAMNTPIQGTAAEILKLACGRIVAGIPERPWLHPILQIHDELVFEIPAEKLTEAVAFVKTCMEVQPFPRFDLPLVAESAAGQSFGSMTELEDAL